MATGFTRVDPSTLITEAAREKLVKWLASRKESDAHAQGSHTRPPETGGTVGAVARDARGSVAAATSTGGTLGKRAGRVGDSPILGAGTYADDRGGAASATGHGEGILRVTLAARAVSEMRAGVSPDEAAAAALDEMFERVGASGGLILVDRRGRLGFARTTEAMAWAAAFDGGDASGE
jgi:beta-aspartyl-peptidase (threonine type)